MRLVLCTPCRSLVQTCPSDQRAARKTISDARTATAPSRHGVLGSWLQRKDVAKRVPEEAGRGDWFGDEAESDLNSIQRIQESRVYNSRNAIAREVRNLQIQKLLIGRNVVGRYMYDVICYSYFVAPLSIGN